MWGFLFAKDLDIARRILSSDTDVNSDSSDDEDVELAYAALTANGLEDGQADETNAELVEETNSIKERKREKRVRQRLRKRLAEHLIKRPTYRPEPPNELENKEQFGGMNGVEAEPVGLTEKTVVDELDQTVESVNDQLGQANQAGTEQVEQVEQAEETMYNAMRTFVPGDTRTLLNEIAQQLDRLEQAVKSKNEQLRVVAGGETESVDKPMSEALDQLESTEQLESKEQLADADGLEVENAEQEEPNMFEHCNHSEHTTESKKAQLEETDQANAKHIERNIDGQFDQPEAADELRNNEQPGEPSGPEAEHVEQAEATTIEYLEQAEHIEPENGHTVESENETPGQDNQVNAEYVESIVSEQHDQPEQTVDSEDHPPGQGKVAVAEYDDQEVDTADTLFIKAIRPLVSEKLVEPIIINLPEMSWYDWRRTFSDPARLETQTYQDILSENEQSVHVDAADPEHIQQADGAAIEQLDQPEQSDGPWSEQPGSGGGQKVEQEERLQSEIDEVENKLFDLKARLDHMRLEGEAEQAEGSMDEQLDQRGTVSFGAMRYEMVKTTDEDIQEWQLIPLGETGVTGHDT